MTDLEVLLARIAELVDHPDESRLPPVVKLTRDQFNSLPVPPAPPFPGIRPTAAGDRLFGVPVQLVETVEESTPHQLVRRRWLERLHRAVRRAVGKAV